MIQIRDAFLNGEEFEFQKNAQGVVQLSFGPTHVCMTLDSAYDLQYSLAAFLAQVELKDYEDDASETFQAGEISEGETFLHYLNHAKRPRKVDA